MAMCRACTEVSAAMAGHDPFAIAELRSGVVRLNPNQYHQGAVFLIARQCVRELHDLPESDLVDHALDLAAVGRAVERAFQPAKLNCEALGNSVPHLHWWITPRHHDDPRPGGPIWEDLDFLRSIWTEGGRPDDEDRVRTRVAVFDQLPSERVLQRLC